MVTGIEVAGLALAALPLLVNQLDAYVLGIEQISCLRSYRREFAYYSKVIGAQHAVLSKTLEEVLGGIMRDENEVSELISDPENTRWKDGALQERLRSRLGRSYEPFVGIMTSISDLLDRLSGKMGVSVLDERVRRGY